MTPKEKAKELYNNYIKILGITDLKVGSNFYAQQCAIIAVDEILNQFIWKPSTGLAYWEEVKREIEKL